MASNIPADAKDNPEFLFQALAAKLSSSSAEVKQRITAHVREVSGHSTLPSFHNNGSTDAEKCAVYRTCIKAVITNDYSALKGSIPAGQAKTESKPAPKEPEKPQEQPEPPEAPTAQAEQKPAAAAAQRTNQPTPASNGSVEGAVKALLAALGNQQPAVTPVDEAQVRQIVEGVVAGTLAERVKEVRGELTMLVNEYIKNIPPRDVLQIQKWDGTITEIKESYHKQLPAIVKALAARNAMGWTEFLYIVGAPGAGKTHMLMQMGKALGVRHFPFPMGPTATEGKILGYNNIANGQFVKGWLYDAYKEGGLVGLDEIDLADGSVLAANNSIENSEFTFGNGELVKRHKDFYLVAFANTIGTGATGGFVRNRLDAATLNRFSIIRLEYDEELEKRIYGNKKWAEYVQRVRKHVAGTMAGSLHITPRATRKGAAYLAAGIAPEVVSDMTLFGMCSKEQKATILQTIGPYVA
jgi:hypothetical protein